ncbi:MAG: ATP-binding protein [Cyanobacteria bacterium J055]|nr:MAG: ATP-binding protein [Cyanobacteria bacterium J055]
MSQIFGDFTEDSNTSQEYIIVGFSPSATPIEQRWRNNGLSADFLADYLKAFFPDNGSFPHINTPSKEIKSAVSYIANELLENAMKFNCNRSPEPIVIQLQVLSDRLIFTTTNSIESQKVSPFQEFLEELMSSDPHDLYVSMLERSALESDRFESHIGYLTMITDYGVKLGWKFENLSADPEVKMVTTMVKLCL